MRAFLVSLLLLLAACSVPEKKGVLVDVEPGTPMDESDLRQHCDLGDIAACALAGLDAVPLPEPRYPIVQGVAPAERAVFAALVPKTASLSWYIFDREVSRLTRLFTPKPISRGDTAWALQRLDAQGLTPGRTYELLAGDAQGKLVESRRFRALALDEKNVRISLIGGLRLASGAQLGRLFARAAQEKPQLLVLSGSAADATLPESLAALKAREARDFFFTRHAEARARFELGLARDLVPIAAAWNDDEFGHVDGDRAFPQRDQAREQLELFFPHWADEVSVVDGPGIALELRFRRQYLELLDDLSFRQPPTAGEEVCVPAKGRKKAVCRPGKGIPAPAGTRYGGILRDWVRDRVAKAERPVWLLANGANLLAYREDWALEKGLNVPELTRTPKSAWEGLIESGPGDSLRLSRLTELPGGR